MATDNEMTADDMLYVGSWEARGMRPDQKEDIVQEFCLGALLAKKRRGEGTEAGQTLRQFQNKYGRGMARNFMRVDRLGVRRRKENANNCKVFDFDAPAGCDGDLTLGDTIPTFGRAEDTRDALTRIVEQETFALVMDAMATLDERSQTIVNRLVVEGEDSAKVGEELGITGSRVRRIRDMAIAKLQEKVK